MDIDWTKVESISRPSEGTAAIFAHFGNGARVVIKGTMSVASELFATLAMRAAGCHVPQTRLVVWPSEEWGLMKGQLFSITKDDEALCRVVTALLNRTIILVQEFSLGAPMNTPLPLEAGLRPLGKVIALDAVLNNSDRLPCGSLWMNDGNPGNLLITAEEQQPRQVGATAGGGGGTVNTNSSASAPGARGIFIIPIDSNTVPIPKPDQYCSKVAKFVADVLDGENSNESNSNRGKKEYAKRTLLWLRNNGLFDLVGVKSERRAAGVSVPDESAILDEAATQLNLGFQDGLEASRILLPNLPSLKSSVFQSKKLVEKDWENCWAMALQSLPTNFYSQMSATVLPPLLKEPPAIDWWDVYKTWAVPPACSQLVITPTTSPYGATTDVNASRSGDGNRRSATAGGASSPIQRPSTTNQVDFRVCVVQETRLDHKRLRQTVCWYQEQHPQGLAPHLVVYPEGTMLKVLDFRPGNSTTTTTAEEGAELLKTLADTAKELGVVLCCGTGPEAATAPGSGETINFETCVVIDGQGDIILRYRKRCHPNGGSVKASGTQPGVVSFPVVSLPGTSDNANLPKAYCVLGVAICHDIEQSHVVTELFEAMEAEERRIRQEQGEEVVVGKVVMNPSHIPHHGGGGGVALATTPPGTELLTWFNSHAAAARKIEHLAVEKGLYFVKADQPQGAGAAMTQVVGPEGTLFVPTARNGAMLACSLPFHNRNAATTQFGSTFSTHRSVFRSERENDIGKRFTIKMMPIDKLLESPPTVGQGKGESGSVKGTAKEGTTSENPNPSTTYLQDAGRLQFLNPTVLGVLGRDSATQVQGINTAMLRESTPQELSRIVTKEVCGDNVQDKPTNVVQVRFLDDGKNLLVLKERRLEYLTTFTLEQRSLYSSSPGEAPEEKWDLPINLPTKQLLPQPIKGSSETYHVSSFLALKFPVGTEFAVLVTISPPACSSGHGSDQSDTPLPTTYLLHVAAAVSGGATCVQTWIGFIGRATARARSIDATGCMLFALQPWKTDCESGSPAPPVYWVNASCGGAASAPPPGSMDTSAGDGARPLSADLRYTIEDPSSLNPKLVFSSAKRTGLGNAQLSLPALPRSGYRGAVWKLVGFADNSAALATVNVKTAEGSASAVGAAKGYPTIVLLYSNTEGNSHVAVIVKFDEGRSPTTFEDLFLPKV